MLIARIDNNAIAETRNASIDDVPSHKRAMWRPVVGDPPDVDAQFYTTTGPVYQIETDCVRRVWQIVPRPLDEVKAEQQGKIDADAGRERLAYITDAPGQDLTYDRKRREALSAIDNPNPTAAQYPVLAASIGIEIPSSGNAKADFDAIALLVIQKEQAWAAIASSIEAKRLGAKKAIAAAQTVDDVAAAARVVW